MVCPKLRAGICRIAKAPCGKKYEIKMRKYKTCSVFKRKTKNTKTKRTKKTKRKSAKKKKRKKKRR